MMKRSSEQPLDAFHPEAEVVPMPQTNRLAPVVSVTERVVMELKAYITDNSLQPGSKLPAERVFLEQLGVSRSSLREAVRVLSTLGLIEVRHGDGMYVSASPETWNASSARLFDTTEKLALRNLVETRLGIEIAAVTVAAQRASAEDLDRLQAFVDEQARHLGVDRAWEPLGFELAVVEVTGNTWLYEVETQLRDAWLSLSRGMRGSIARYEEWLNEHRAIVASIRARNAVQAQRLVMAHLSLERLEDDLRSPAERAAKRAANEGTDGRRAL